MQAIVRDGFPTDLIKVAYLPFAVVFVTPAIYFPYTVAIISSISLNSICSNTDFEHLISSSLRMEILPATPGKRKSPNESSDTHSHPSTVELFYDWPSDRKIPPEDATVVYINTMVEAKKLSIGNKIAAVREAVAHLLQRFWTLDGPACPMKRPHDRMRTKSHINAVFGAKELPNADKISVVHAAAIHIVQCFTAVIEKTAPGSVSSETLECHIGNLRASDEASISISKKTKIIVNATLYLLEEFCLIDPNTCMTVCEDENGSDTGTGCG